MRTIGGIDVSGPQKLPEFGERIVFSPGLASEAAGAPTLDEAGHVVAILGDSTTPGGRVNRHDARHRLRVDVFPDDRPVWRTFLRVID